MQVRMWPLQNNSCCDVDVTPNRAFDTDTQLHWVARRADDRTPRGPMQLRAGQLRR